MFCGQVHAVVGVLSDDTDPMVTVMKLEKAPQETYADIGGLDTQIQEIKVKKLFYLFVAVFYDNVAHSHNFLKLEDFVFAK